VEYVDPHDVNDIRRGLQLVLASPEMAHGLSERGVCRANEFVWKKTGERFLEILGDVVKGTG
jgi:hypothetical protein